MKITLRYAADRVLVKPKILIGIYDQNEVGIYGLDSEAAGGLPENLPASGEVTCVTAPIHRRPGPVRLILLSLTAGAWPTMMQCRKLYRRVGRLLRIGRTTDRNWMIGLLHHKWSLS